MIKGEGVPIYAMSRFRAAISHFHAASNDSPAIASCQQRMLMSHETRAVTPNANDPLMRRPIYHDSMPSIIFLQKFHQQNVVIEVVESCTKEKGDFTH